jgi:hypothetical protein
MSGMSNQAGTGEKARRRKRPVDLKTARRMLPLVQRIVVDIVHDAQELNKYTFEQEGLDRNKTNLTWPERQRRYTVQGEVARLQSRLEEEKRELDSLGAVLFNPPSIGLVGFPTTINDRQAYFSWRLGEESLKFWHFDGEEKSREPIPPNLEETNSGRIINQN